MTGVVLDCSVTAAWLFEDEASALAEAMLEQLGGGLTARVPSVWVLEVCNVLLVGERRGRLSEAQSTVFWETLQALPIAVDDRPPMVTAQAVVALGRAHQLSAYDAAYLELAVREGLPVATLDQRLVASAQASGAGVWAPLA